MVQMKKQQNNSNKEADAQAIQQELGVPSPGEEKAPIKTVYPDGTVKEDN